MMARLSNIVQRTVEYGVIKGFDIIDIIHAFRKRLRTEPPTKNIRK